MMKKNILRFLTIFVLTSVLTSCFGGGEDDGTLGNWFIAILWILVWLKGGNR